MSPVWRLFVFFAIGTVGGSCLVVGAILLNAWLRSP